MPEQNPLQTIDIVIPTRGRASSVSELLCCILVQTVLPKKIVIVDDSFDNQTEELIVRKQRDFANREIKLVHMWGDGLYPKGICRARNLGMRETTADIVLFLDDDILMDVHYIEKLLEVYSKNPSAMGVQGYMGCPNFSSTSHAINRIFLLYYAEKDKNRLLCSTGLTWPHSLEKVTPSEWMSGTNSSYKRSIITEFAWDNKLGEYSLYDDVDFSCRVLKKYSHSLFMTPFARYSHKNSSNARRKPKLDTLIRINYPVYFFFKNIKQTSGNRLKFLWSMFGRFFVIFLWRKTPRQIFYLMSAYVFALRNLRSVQVGEFKFLLMPKAHQLILKQLYKKLTENRFSMLLNIRHETMDN